MKKFLFLGLVALTALVASCTDYGDKVEKGKTEVYYKDGATEEEAQALMDLLFEQKYFNEDKENSVQILKDGDTYHVNFVVKEDFWDKEDVIQGFKFMGRLIQSEVLDGADLIVNLCNDKLESQKEIKIE